MVPGNQFESERNRRPTQTERGVSDFGGMVDFFVEGGRLGKREEANRLAAILCLVS